jgi:5'-3' exonuclease
MSSGFLITYYLQGGFDMKHLVIDYSNFVLRAFHAHSATLDYEGEVVSHIFGTVQLLLSSYTKLKIDKVHFVRDGRNQWKKAEFPSYKGNREKKERSSVDIFKECANLFEKMPCTFHINDVEEADDVIYSLTHDLIEEDPTNTVYILSSDQDLYCLLSHPNVFMVGKGVSLLSSEVPMKKYGVPPEHVALFKSFFGDAVDNVKGLPRVRRKILTPKFASDKTVEDIYRDYENDPDSIPFSKKEHEKFVHWKNQILENEKLVTLRRVPYETTTFSGDYNAFLEILVDQHHCPSYEDRVYVLFEKGDDYDAFGFPLNLSFRF